ncbi:MAG: cellulase family glycosylhydrolase [Candidatus Bathyarchaeia archaeon]|jgi:hypothetical protein
MWGSLRIRHFAIILLIVVLGTSLMTGPSFSQLSRSISLSATGTIKANISTIFNSGWENSKGTDITDGGIWDSSSTGLVITSPVYNGNYSAYFATSSGQNIGVGKTLSETYSTLYFRAYLYFPNVITANTWVILMSLYDSNWANGIQVVLQNCFGYSEWQLITPSNTYSSLPAVVSPNTWYCVEVERQIGSGNGTAVLWVDGNMLCNSTSETMTVGTQHVTLGAIGNNFTVVADDVVASSTGPIGPELPIAPLPLPTPVTNFEMRGAAVACDVFAPTARNYNPDAWQLLKEVGINTICVCGSVEGDTLQININDYPNTWAQNLNNFLSEAAQNGIKVYFSDLGDSWGSLFGIISPRVTAGGLPSTPITQAEAMIGELAGNNSLGHDFITDPRIVGWRTSNELDISNETILNWNLQVASYIRSLDGKAWLASPNFSGDTEFSVTLPLLQGNVDYVEIHAYMLSEFYNNSNVMDYNSFFNFYKSYLETAVVQPAQQNGYPLSQVILGEFGLWTGEGSDQGVTANFTDAERAVYYQAVFDAAKADGIQNVLFYTFFSEIEPDGTYIIHNYGVYGNATFYPNLCSIISNAYNP